MAKIKEGADESSSSSTSSPQPHRTRILIVDDEEDVTFFLKKALEGHAGFEVDTFNDPLLALSSFDNYNTDKEAGGGGTYDLILLDIKMPKMDGFELYQEIQKRIDPTAAGGGGGRSTDDNDQGKNGKKTKICFMTAFEVYYEALKELFPDTYSSICFIKKPSSAQDLIKRISREI